MSSYLCDQFRWGRLEKIAPFATEEEGTFSHDFVSNFHDTSVSENLNSLKH